MSGVVIDAAWSHHGVPALVLRNRWLTVTVLPDLGGKVWQVFDHVSGRDLLWHNPSLRARPVAFGAAYDDVFHGGWDELFPNDVPESLAGEAYPDHGELWALPWDATVIETGDRAVVELRVRTPISTCDVTKRITLESDRRGLSVHASITSHARTDLPAMWKQHLALAIDDSARLLLPASRVTMGDFGAPRAGSAGAEFDWPMLDGVDMSTTPAPGSGVSEFWFAHDLADGRVGLQHADGTVVSLGFDTADLPSCWVFASYGAWRGLDVVVLEPCTGYGLSVADGVAAGTHRVLPAGGSWRTRLELEVTGGGV